MPIALPGPDKAKSAMTACSRTNSLRPSAVSITCVCFLGDERSTLPSLFVAPREPATGNLSSDAGCSEERRDSGSASTHALCKSPLASTRIRTRPPSIGERTLVLSHTTTPSAECASRLGAAPGASHRPRNCSPRPRNPSLRPPTQPRSRRRDATQPKAAHSRVAPSGMSATASAAERTTLSI